jgi:hypothetical protein
MPILFVMLSSGDAKKIAAGSNLDRTIFVLGPSTMSDDEKVLGEEEEEVTDLSNR